LPQLSISLLERFNRKLHELMKRPTQEMDGEAKCEGHTLLQNKPEQSKERSERRNRQFTIIDI
jgi:hypothetical protein